jgi:hypothetical protein
MWEEADMQERNTAVFSATALFEKIGFALLSATGRMKYHDISEINVIMRSV